MRLFTRRPILGLRLVALICASFILMVGDFRYAKVDELRSVLSYIVTPIQFLVDWPLEFIDWAQISMSSHQSLLTENTHLRAEQLLLKAQLQKFISLQSENQRLRALLQSSSQIDGQVVVTQILAVSANPYVRQIVLARGSHGGTFVGQPVLDATGVLGQVIQVNPLTSQVLLITDPQSAIPVQDSVSGVRGIVVGNGSSNQLSMINMPITTIIKPGDLLVTSGLGQRFPAGYPVGKVESVERKPGEAFAAIMVTPSAEINRSRLVLLVKPNSSTKQIQSSDAR